MRAISAIAASLLIGACDVVSVGRDDRSGAFAQTIEGVDHAKTITWTTTFYERVTSGWKTDLAQETGAAIARLSATWTVSRNLPGRSGKTPAGQDYRR